MVRPCPVEPFAIKGNEAPAQPPLLLVLVLPQLANPARATKILGLFKALLRIIVADC